MLKTNLIRLRRQADLTQPELSALSRVPQTTISAIENGTTTRPQAHTLLRIAKALSKRLLRAVKLEELLK